MLDIQGQQVYIPEGYFHGFYCPIPSIVLYKCTNYFRNKDEIGVRWDDPDLAIRWPIGQPVVSEKDARGYKLRDLPAERLFP